MFYVWEELGTDTSQHKRRAVAKAATTLSSVCFHNKVVAGTRLPARGYISQQLVHLGLSKFPHPWECEKTGAFSRQAQPIKPCICSPGTFCYKSE